MSRFFCFFFPLVCLSISVWWFSHEIIMCVSVLHWFMSNQTLKYEEHVVAQTNMSVFLFSRRGDSWSVRLPSCDRPLCSRIQRISKWVGQKTRCFLLWATVLHTVQLLCIYVCQQSIWSSGCSWTCSFNHDEGKVVAEGQVMCVRRQQRSFIVPKKKKRQHLRHIKRKSKTAARPAFIYLFSSLPKSEISCFTQVFLCVRLCAEAAVVVFCCLQRLMLDSVSDGQLQLRYILCSLAAQVPVQISNVRGRTGQAGIIFLF